MAKALQCPACGSRHPLSDLPDAPTFRCDGCGRALKVPARVRPSQGRSGSSARPRPGPDRTATIPAGGGAAAGATAGAAAAGTGAGGGVAAPPAPLPPPPVPPAAAGRRRRREPEPGPRKLAWPFRVIAWVIALPLGLVLVVWPMRRFGFLSGQRLLDVLVGTGWGRYWRVLVIAPLWALVTAVLVHLIQMGMRKLGERRQAIHSAKSGDDDTPDPKGNSSRRSRREQASSSKGRRKKGR